MSLTELLNVPDTQRDVLWERRFFDAVISSKLKVLSADPQQGPDGWPYLMTETSLEATEPAPKILNWLATRGIGLVVNPGKKSYPDYVFNYGMVWHFKETNLFVRPQDEVPAGAVDIAPATGLHAGAPTKEYLPDYVRTILREFFRDQNLLAVKILVMSQDRKHYDLAFSLESLGNPPEKEFEGISQAIAWFLPTHYSLILVSEKGLPPFVNL
ncbi:MAG: hypothetical protein KF802_10315 [Bdellovibrionaceae bacterium]|nr:hypothetical protein [Pseudobdellovibrionaceae bacterium]